MASEQNRDGFKRIHVTSSSASQIEAERPEGDEEVIYVGPTGSDEAPPVEGSTHDSKPKDEWREQTLEDIDNVKVPFKNGQRAVLVASAVFVAVTVAYLALF